MKHKFERPKMIKSWKEFDSRNKIWLLNFWQDRFFKSRSFVFDKTFLNPIAICIIEKKFFLTNITHIYISFITPMLKKSCRLAIYFKLLKEKEWKIKINWKMSLLIVLIFSLDGCVSAVLVCMLSDLFRRNFF